MKMTSRIFVVLALAASVAGNAFALAIDGNEWQDLTRMSAGREKTRASFAPFPDEQSALAILPDKTPRQICLDSLTAWKFKWSKDPASRPVGFEKPNYDVSSWEVIRVPCSWQAFEANGKGGWGTPLYTNARYPFKVNPPRVMDEPPRDFTNFKARNPVGSYRRDFDLPADWQGDRVFLKFDGVDSFYYLWVNGQYVGFTKDSRCAAEYDVTDWVKPGKNVVALEVYRYSDGSYFEDQDMFRLSGIFRSSWLVRRPKLRVRDFFATATPVEAGRYDGDWRLTVNTELAGTGDGTVKVSLFDLAGKPVALNPVAGADGVFTVTRPKLWSPECPNCYKVVVSLAQGGKTLESVSTLFGFRESKIIKGRYCLNGQKVKLHGADRHETDPRYGHFCPRERHEQDVALLKRANCNMVRNSHYPQDDYWYYLCDLNGICLMDEANVESHGIWNVTPREERFRKALVWRNMNMVERNKNHPAVIFWSHGNECGSGRNFRAADDAVHQRDPSRPTHYEGDWSNSDVDSNMYPSVNLVWWHAKDKNAKRPYYICEYAHNMMNAMGNLKDYQDAIDSSDVVIGGTIWDWVDQGLYKLNKDGVKIIGYGGDWGDRPNSGQFVMNGCILSDRELEPGYWEIKHVYQPVSVTLDEGAQSVTVWNKQFFRGLDVYNVTASVLVNGERQTTMKVDLDAVPPRGKKTLMIPEAARRALGPGKAVSVRYAFAVKARDGYLEPGYVIADDQVDLPNAKAAVALEAPKGKAASRVENGQLTFKAGDVRLAFEQKTGALVSYRVKGEERLFQPMTLDAYRAPSSNEVGPGSRWGSNGWRVFTAKAVTFGDVKEEAGALAFTAEIEYAGRSRENLHGFGGGGEPGARLETLDKKPSKMVPQFRAMQHWRIYADGTVTCQSEIRPVGGVRAELPRIGYHFVLPLDYAQVSWFGRGPFENYRDRKSGAFRGRWETDLTKFVMPYARPEDANNFEETDAVTLSGVKGAIGFATLGKPFAFAAIPYSAKEIIETMHPAELPKPAKVEFGIFAETRGLGGASCGPGPLARDIIDTSHPYRLDFAILPRAAHTALEVPAVDLPPSDVGSALVLGRYKVLSVSSEQGGDEKASHAFDGKPETIWHSKWSPSETRYPHAIACDYGEVKKVFGLSVIPRQDGNPNGRVKGYKVEVSLDAQNWTPVLSGELPNTDEVTELRFQTPVQARYLRFTALSSRFNQPWASFAELQPLLK